MTKIVTILTKCFFHIWTLQATLRIHLNGSAIRCFRLRHREGYFIYFNSHLCFLLDVFNRCSLVQLKKLIGKPMSDICLKELLNCTLRIILVWSLFCLIRVYVGLHFLQFFSKTSFLFFLCFLCFLFWVKCFEARH